MLGRFPGLLTTSKLISIYYTYGVEGGQLVFMGTIHSKVNGEPLGTDREGKLVFTDYIMGSFTNWPPSSRYMSVKALKTRDESTDTLSSASCRIAVDLTMEEEGETRRGGGFTDKFSSKLNFST